MSISIEYLAGLFDGEGCVDISQAKPKRGKRHGTYSICLRIAMTDIVLVNMLKDNFGGYIIGGRKKSKPHHLEQACWRLRITEARKLIPKLLPHVIHKQEQLMLALILDYLNSKRSAETRAAKEYIYHLAKYSKHQRLRDETPTSISKLAVPIATVSETCAPA